jgi:soluble lytic murein transglycosylase-like protein
VSAPAFRRASFSGATLLAAVLLALSCDPQAPAATRGARAPLAPAAPHTPGRAQQSAPQTARGARVRARLVERCQGLTEWELTSLATALVRESAAHGLAPELVLAVVEVESNCDPHAVSPVGALGLMQILPSTGAELARRLRIPWRGPRTLFDPVTNLRLGVAYLRELRDRYDNVGIALAAYNWGPGRIDARLRRGKPLPQRYPRRVLAVYSDRRARGETDS